MTFDEYVASAQNKLIDVDGAFGAQCVDLVRDYAKKVLNAQLSPPKPAAKDIWDSYYPNEFIRISNAPNNKPSKGDIIIWGTAYGQYGHIAICIDADTRTFTALSQNDPIGAKAGIKKYSSYKGVLGWLTPIRGGNLAEIERLQQEADNARKARDINWNLYQNALSEIEILKKTVIKITDEYNQANESIKQLTEKLAQAEAIIRNLNDQLHVARNTCIGQLGARELIRETLKAIKEGRL